MKLTEKQKRVTRVARQIIAANKYLTLATSSGKRPWAAPLYYCEHKGEFYCMSLPNSRHNQDLKKNPRVAFAIFDSHAKEGEGNGVQGSGKMKELRGKELLTKRKYFRTSFEVVDGNDESPYRLYRLTPDKLYVRDPEELLDKRSLVGDLSS